MSSKNNKSSSSSTSINQSQSSSSSILSNYLPSYIYSLLFDHSYLPIFALIIILFESVALIAIIEKVKCKINYIYICKKRIHACTHIHREIL